ALANVIAPYDPLLINYQATFTPPGGNYWVGTDDFGRDLLSRIIHGSRISIYVGVLAVILGPTTGALIGLISGYAGGKTDLIVQRFMDILVSFPLLILAIAIVAALGPSTTNAVIAIALVLVPYGCRVIRSSVLSLKAMTYVDAARAMGCPPWRILFIHILPNCLAPYVILASMQLGQAILIEASLGFLGLGTPPPAPSWGSMLSGAGRQFVEVAPWMAIYPGIAITSAVFGANLLGDALRDVWDPKLRRA
ncbi:MAG: ABC transporter permease, partial [Chloroflexota bacterium]|nr:ABC transporter permease [Chloroflexota bacterium]